MLFFNASTDTKRREISDSTGHQFRHAVLIDSIGNAASDHSLDTIISHINAPHPLTVQHSALRALRHYKNEKVQQNNDNMHTCICVVFPCSLRLFY